MRPNKRNCQQRFYELDPLSGVADCQAQVPRFIRQMGFWLERELHLVLAGLGEVEQGIRSASIYLCNHLE